MIYYRSRMLAGSNVEVITVSKSNRIKMNKANAPVTEVVVKKAMNPLLKKVLIWVLIVVLLLGSVGILSVSAIQKNGTLIRRADGINIDGTVYKASEVDYYYNLYAQSLSSTAYTYATQYGIDVYGIDFTKSLFKQSYTQDSDSDGTPDFDTWGDYVLDQAVTSLFNYVLLNNEAKANGFLDIPGVEKQIARSVESTIEDTKAEAEANGVSMLAYLRTFYGATVTEDSYRDAVRRETIASLYSNYVFEGIEIEDWEIAEEYKDNKNNYDTVDFLSFDVTVELEKHLDADGKEYSDEATKEADDKKVTEVSAVLRDELKNVANIKDFEELAEKYNAKDGDAEDKIYAPVQEKVSFESLEDADAAVLFADTAAEGDTFVNRDENVLRVFYFVSRDDNHYPTRTFRHILLKSDEKDTEVEARANELLAQWKAGAKTEESFAELVGENTDDIANMLDGGIVENVGVDTVVDEISAWVFDEARETGDTEIIFTESYGYHIVYFCGEDADVEYWEVLCDDSLRSAEYDKVIEETTAKHSYKKLDGLGRIK